MLTRMVFYNSRGSLHSFIHFCSFIMFITLYLPHGNTLNFNLTNISPKNLNVDITVEQNAYLSIQGIQLSSNQYRLYGSQESGRVMYVEPLRLWDKASGSLTNFATHFLFVVDSPRKFLSGDGLAFFLIPPGDSKITAGGAMGLPIDLSTYRATTPFVAVEFDAYNNHDVDPHNITTHVGIDINSLVSNSTAVWEKDVYSGLENEAWITYNSSSKNLSVIFSGYRNTTKVIQGLHLIVDLRKYIPEWVKIGFSASSGTLFARHSVRSWQFNSDLHFDELTQKVIRGGRNRMGILVGSTIGLLFIIIGLSLIGFILWEKSIAKEDGVSFQFSMEDLGMGCGPKKFSYMTLSRATNNFDEEQKLGAGGFGEVYRGFLSELNCYVAVKKIAKGSKQGIKEYAAEVKIISRLRHRNLVRLIGWCHEKQELLLVYEFLSNSSLDTHIFKDKSLLTWDNRYKIAKSLASALLYLHEEWEQCVVHRDVKPSNVMLDENFNAKLGDFGLARLIDHEKGTQTTVLAGTMGYMAPENLVLGKASKESDVYSFGVVVLEIACGRKPIDTSVAQERDVMLVEFVWNHYGDGTILNAVDPKLSTDFDQQEMERLMIVGLWCAHPDHNLRPSIRQALCVLNLEAPLPILPGKIPVAIYSSVSVNIL